MSVDVMSRVWKDSPQKANKLLVLLAIADIADDNGWAYPAQNTLAKKCRVGRRGVQKLLDELERIGELVIYNRFDPTTPEQHFSNVYHLAKYGEANAAIPHELRGVIRKRNERSEQPDTTGVVNVETLGGSEQPDTRVVNSHSLPSEQPDTRVVNSGSHYSLQEPSVTPPQELKESARDSDPTPYHIANGLGSNGKRNDNALVLAIKEHPAYQAFVAGWDGIMPEVNPRNAETTWDGLNYLQREIDAGHLSYRDIEDVTRWKVSNPRTQGYQVIYVKVDLPAFKAAMRAEANRKPPPRAAPNGSGAHAPPAPAPAHKPSEGVSGLKARLKAEQQAKQGG